MPRKPKHPCAHPGCPKLLETGERFCEKHAKEAARDYERYGRDPQARKRYGSAWRKIRWQYIKAHPLCEECLKGGRAVPATEVHHRLPLSDGGDNSRLTWRRYVSIVIQRFMQNEEIDGNKERGGAGEGAVIISSKWKFRQRCRGSVLKKCNFKRV